MVLDAEDNIGTILVRCPVAVSPADRRLMMASALVTRHGFPRRAAPAEVPRRRLCVPRVMPTDGVVAGPLGSQEGRGHNVTVVAPPRHLGHGPPCSVTSDDGCTCYARVHKAIEIRRRIHSAAFTAWVEWRTGRYSHAERSD